MDPQLEEVLFLTGKANMTFKKDWQDLVVTKPKTYVNLFYENWWGEEAY